MKIGIITFHNGSNYGAALQSFALQEALKKKKQNDVSIINYKNPFIMKGLNSFRFEFSIKGFYFLLIDIINYKDRKTKKINFFKFFNKYQLSPLLSKTELKNIDLKYDLIFSGSDQIWNPNLIGSIDDIYFGVIKNAKRKISYGSSVGNYSFNNHFYNGEIRTLLEGFEKISVREKAEDIQTITQKKVFKVCDPTLLLDKRDWESCINETPFKEKYLLIYALSEKYSIIQYAKKIAKEKNLKIYVIDGMIRKSQGVQYVYGNGPSEFINLFLNASYIVTNSFHGTAFAVNFQKNFVSVIHPKSPERAREFLQSVGLIHRLVQNNEYIEDISNLEINNSQNLLKIIRENSLDFLDVQASVSYES